MPPVTTSSDQQSEQKGSNFHGDLRSFGNGLTHFTKRVAAFLFYCPAEGAGAQ